MLPCGNYSTKNTQKKTSQLWIHGIAAAVAILLSTGCGASKDENSVKAGSPESSSYELNAVPSETDSNRRPQLADIVDTAVAAGKRQR